MHTHTQLNKGTMTPCSGNHMVMSVNIF